MNNSVKVVGGSFGGAFDMETVNRLVRAHFTVVVKPSGRSVFVDRDGRAVSLYFTVDPETTEAGKEALATDRAKRAKDSEAEAVKRAEIERLLDSMSPDEALELLTREETKEVE
ncbi:hypothetical protein [Sphingobium sp. MK2]|uniref:hypothetical protein n=1 Tax=Sphingobium sp. MK2 TaxID=3116540 RepID=UPI0032E3659D